MAFRSARYTVGTSAVQVIDALAGDVEAWVEVATSTGANCVYLGGSAVTTSDGFRLENNDNIINTKIRPGDELWAIADSSSFSVHVMIRSA